MLHCGHGYPTPVLQAGRELMHVGFASKHQCVDVVWNVSFLNSLWTCGATAMSPSVLSLLCMDVLGWIIEPDWRHHLATCMNKLWKLWRNNTAKRCDVPAAKVH